MANTVIIPHNYAEYVKNKFPVDDKESERLSYILLDNASNILIDGIKDKIREQIKMLLKIYALQDHNIVITGNTISLRRFFDFNMDNGNIKTIIKIIINSDNFTCNLHITNEHEDIKILYQSLFEKVVKMIYKISQEPIKLNYNILYTSHDIIKDGILDYTNYRKICNYLKEKNIDIRLYTELDRIIIKIYDTKRKIYKTFTLKLNHVISRIFSMLNNVVILPRKKITYILMPINGTTKPLYLVSFIYEDKMEYIVVSSNVDNIKQEDIEIFKSVCNEVINKELGKIYDIITCIT